MLLSTDVLRRDFQSLKEIFDRYDLKSISILQEIDWLKKIENWNEKIDDDVFDEKLI